MQANRFFFENRDFNEQFNRVAREQAELAITELHGVTLQDQKGIHEARKRLKRLRACYQLLKPLDRAAAQAGNELFKAVAKKLSGYRDNLVLLETTDSICERNTDLAADREVRNFRNHLNQESNSAAEDMSQHLQEARDSLRHYVEQLTLSPPTGFDAANCVAGVLATYKRCRKLWKQSYRTHVEDDFHAWRRVVKYHMHHMELLCNLDTILNARIHLLSQLSELLGSFHDLSVLKCKLAEQQAASASLSATVESRQREQLRQANKLAKKLFADSVAEFSLALQAMLDDSRRQLVTAETEISPPSERYERPPAEDEQRS